MKIDDHVLCLFLEPVELGGVLIIRESKSVIGQLKREMARGLSVGSLMMCLVHQDDVVSFFFLREVDWAYHIHVL